MTKNIVNATRLGRSVAGFFCAAAATALAAQTVSDGQQVPGLGAMTKMMPLMSFATLFTVAVVPLAAALYVVTSMTWAAVERAVLYRDMPGAAAAPALAV